MRELNLDESCFEERKRIIAVLHKQIDDLFAKKRSYGDAHTRAWEEANRYILKEWNTSARIMREADIVYNQKSAEIDAQVEKIISLINEISLYMSCDEVYKLGATIPGGQKSQPQGQTTSSHQASYIPIQEQQKTLARTPSPPPAPVYQKPPSKPSAPPAYQKPPSRPVPASQAAQQPKPQAVANPQQSKTALPQGKGKPASAGYTKPATPKPAAQAYQKPPQSREQVAFEEDPAHYSAAELRQAQSLLKQAAQLEQAGRLPAVKEILNEWTKSQADARLTKEQRAAAEADYRSKLHARQRLDLSRSPGQRQVFAAQKGVSSFIELLPDGTLHTYEDQTLAKNTWRRVEEWTYPDGTSLSRNSVGERSGAGGRKTNASHSFLDETIELYESPTRQKIASTSESRTQVGGSQPPGGGAGITTQEMNRILEEVRQSHRHGPWDQEKR